MEFIKVLEKLGIEKYEQRILDSNSHGELFHIQQYYVLADALSHEYSEWFAEWFDDIVKQAEENWKRPESVFQHIDKILLKHIDSFLNPNP